jgi:hypothetical protein
MKLRTIALLALCLVAAAVPRADGQTDPYKPPLYWSAYEYNIVRQQIGLECDNYIPEYEFLANADFVDANLKKLGYNMIEIDGWGDSSILSPNGYRASHSRLWEHDFAWWSNYLRSRGLKLGMYGNPLWIHVNVADTQTKIAGTDINVSSLINPAENPSALNQRDTPDPNACPSGFGGFQWVQVDRPGAEQYVKGYIKFYADMGIDFFRIDFLPWYENGFDRYLGRVGVDRPREQYATALRWMREAADQYHVYLSFAMAHMFNEGELERQSAHMVRIDEDVDYGEWYKFSDKDRGHRFAEWSQWANAFDGFTYWSYISGRNKIRLDGDFIRMNTYKTDSERRTVISTHLMAGGPIGVADQYNSIGDSLWVYQNPELLALNADAFVGAPRTNDPTNETSQIWSGQMTNGDTILGLFNREITPQTRSVTFAEIGVQGDAAVRDLWQHASLGSMNALSMTLPPHGSIMLKLTKGPAGCKPQTISFDKIDDWSDPNPPPKVSAAASSGLPVGFEVALGPATSDGKSVRPTGQSGPVYVVAKQVGGGNVCAAIPQVQSFNATGPHKTDMFVFGTFTNWKPIRMRLQNNGEWIAEHIPIAAGDQESKFADSNVFGDQDWGNGQGLAGKVQVTTGGGPNTKFTVSQRGFYKVSFNDVTLDYVFEPDGTPFDKQ